MSNLQQHKTSSPEILPKRKLKSGWTTGTCATAACRAALEGLITGKIPKNIEVITPSGKIAKLAVEKGRIYNDKKAMAGIIKDAGDDPDITHGALVFVCLTRQEKQIGNKSDIQFKAGEGVGVITKAGLPLNIGEPAINPVPRQMIDNMIREIERHHSQTPHHYEVEIGVENGEVLAQKTWNPRLGIIGGLSILGTTGVVRPFSCSAWIASIHRGIDVGRANGLSHMVAATGNQSEKAVRAKYSVEDIAAIDMGDFIGGMLKYLRKHPIERLTIAGGVAKLTKFSQGAMDLHSARSQIDFKQLSKLAQSQAKIPHDKLSNLNTMLELMERIDDDERIRLLSLIARDCLNHAYEILRHRHIKVNFMLCDRIGNRLYETGFDG